MLSTATRAPSVLVVGSVNSDLFIRSRRLPLAGESIAGREYSRAPGGKGANQAVAAARLGASVTLVGKTGDDPEGRGLKSSLADAGIRTEFMSCCASKRTGFAVIAIDDEGQNFIIAIPGANDAVKPLDVELALRAATYDVLMLQLEIPLETVFATCRLAREQGIPVVLDAGPAREIALEELRGVTILTPNETETLALTGIRPDSHEAAVRAAGQLLDKSGAGAVVLKLGRRGALLRQRGEACEYFPAIPVQAVDATAAGDAFTAAMTIEYVRTGDLRRAIRWGNAAGALAAMHFGAQPSLPTEQKLQEFCSSQAAAYVD